MTWSTVRYGAFLVAVFLLGGCSPNQPPKASGGGNFLLTRGLSGEPDSLDPAGSTDSFSTQVLQDLYEGLVTNAPNGDLIGAAAESWTTNADGTQYVFHIRNNATWSNGKPLTAQNFVDAWQRVLDPKRASPASQDLRLLKGAVGIIQGKAPPGSLGVIATDEHELVVNLEQPAPYFLQILTHSAAFPIYSDESARSRSPAVKVSNGPYLLEAWYPGTKVDLKRNEHYWDINNVDIQHVEYQINTDQNAQFAAYRAGQLDLTDNIPSNAIAALRAEHSTEMVIAPYLAVAYLGLNFASTPFSGNLALRRALAMAIDRSRLVDALGLGQSPAFGIVPPGTWNYESQHWEWDRLSNQDRLTEAKRLYAEAGYSKTKPLRLRLLFNSNPSIKQTAIMIAAMWKEELGIDTEMTDEEFRVFLQSRQDKAKWDVVRLAWSADYNDAGSFLEIFRRSSSNNDTGYSNAAFDALIDDAAHTADPTIRRNLLQQAESTMLSDYPIAPLFYFVSKRLVKPYVIGLKPNPLDRIASKSLRVLPH